MKILPIAQAADSFPGAPSRQYLCKISKKPDRPDFFIDHGGKIQIDIDSKSWKQFILSRTQPKQPKPKPPRKPRQRKKQKPPAQPKPIKPPPPPDDDEEKPDKTAETEIDDFVDDTWELKRQKLVEEVRKKKIENERLSNELRKQSGELIDFSLANFLFFGYLEKINLEKLRFPQKIEGKIELIITDAIRDNSDPKTAAKKIVNMIIREEEVILRETKKEQSREVKDWKRDTKIK